MMLAKVHVVNGRKLVAVCDSELLGKKFEEKGLQIDLTGQFYKGGQVDEEKLRELLENVYVANFVGKIAVGAGIRTGFVKKENVKVIAGVPHAQAFSID